MEPFLVALAASCRLAILDADCAARREIELQCQDTSIGGLGEASCPNHQLLEKL